MQRFTPFAGTRSAGNQSIKSRHAGLRPRRNKRRPRLEVLEKRNLLAATVTETFQSELFFDQFGGGEARVFNHGYDEQGNEQAEFFGLDLCKARSCGGQPLSVGNYPDAFSIGAEAEIELKLGVEYGVYANAGTASLDYDGTFNYEVIDRGDGPIQIATNIDYTSGALFTQSPTAEAFADLVLIVDADVSGGACAFGGCVEGELDFPRIEERVELIGLNRGKSGSIDLIGTSLIEQGLGVYDRVSGGREDKQGGRRDQYKADRDLELAESEAERNAARQNRTTADNRVASGQTAEANARTSASNSVKGKSFGGGQIVQVSFGEDPGDLLGAEFELSVGTGIKNAANISKRFGALSVTVPDIALSDTTLGNEDQLTAATVQDDPRRNIANLNLDLGAIVGGGFGLGETKVEIGPLEIALTTVSYDLDTSLRLNQEVEAKPKEQLRFEFAGKTGQPLAVDVLVNNQLVSSVTEVSFLDGDDVRVVPGGSETIIVTPSLIPAYEFTNDMGLDLDITGTLRALQLALSGLGLDEVWGPLIEIETPLADFDLASLLDETFDVSADPIIFDSFEIGGPQSDLDVKLGRPSVAYQDATATIAPLVISNAGPDLARNVVATARVPDQLEFDLDQLPPGVTYQQTPSGAVITATIDRLDVGEEASFDLGFTPNVRIGASLYMPMSITSDSRDASPFVEGAELFVEKGLVLDVYNTADWYGDNEDSYNFRKRECDKGSRGSDACVLRGAIERANRNPGHDVILLQSVTDYYLEGPVEVTDSLTIVGRQGSFIQPAELTPFLDIGGTPSAWEFQTSMLGLNGTDSVISARHLASEYNNRGSVYVSQDRSRYTMTAEVIEGDGNGAIPLDSEWTFRSQATNLEKVDGKAVITFEVPGENNDFQVTLEPRTAQQLGLSSLETFELELRARQEGRHQMLVFNGDNEEFTIHGIGVRDGNADQGDSSSGVGAAITVTGTGNNLVLSNTHLHNNYAAAGGAVFMQEGTLTIRDSTFTDNVAAYQGGAISVEGVTVSIEDSSFLRNRSVRGAALYADVFTETIASQIARTLFADNEAADDSGVIAVATYDAASVDLSVEESSFLGTHSLYFHDVPNDDGDFRVQSQGSNLSDREIPPFDQQTDRVGQPFSLSETRVPVDQAGAVVGDFQFQQPGFLADESVEFEFDDPRFEVLAGELRLREDAMFTAADGSLDLTVTATNPRGDQSRQTFTLEALTTPSPVTITLTGGGTDNVLILWSVVDQSDGYRVFQQLEDGTEKLVATTGPGVDETFAEIDALQPDTAYRFRVESYNRSGTASSELVSVSTAQLAAGLPGDVTLEALSTDVLEVTWSAAENAEAYAVFLDDVLVAELAATAERFLVTGLVPNQTVDVVVSAINRSGETAIVPRDFTMPPLAPNVPAAFDTLEGQTGTIKLRWDSVQDAGEYRVFRSVDRGTPQEIALLPGDATEFVVDGIVEGQRDEFELRVYNRSGATKSLVIAGEFAANADVAEVIFETEQPGSLDPAERLGDQYENLKAIRVRIDEPTDVILDAQRFDQLVTSTGRLDLHLEAEHIFDVGEGWANGEPTIDDGQFFRVLVQGDRQLRIDRSDAYRNPLDAFDVDNSGAVTPLDALQIINRLAVQTGQLPTPDAQQLDQFRFVDVSGDGAATPIDALRVINELALRRETDSTAISLPLIGKLSHTDHEDHVDAIFADGGDGGFLF